MINTNYNQATANKESIKSDPNTIGSEQNTHKVIGDEEDIQ